MVRHAIAIVTLVSSVLSLADTAHGKEFKQIKGQFDFIHAAVNPEAAGLCLEPVPGLSFEDVNGPFVGSASGIGDFSGFGSADVCAFFEPIFGIYAQYTGSLEWETVDGLVLKGDFFGIDINPFVFSPEGQALAFETIILIVFTDDEGRFCGTAIAKGIDDPFGVLSGNPAQAGVTADFKGKIGL